MRIHLSFLGCRLNEAELERWRREFLRRGHHIAAAPEDADVCILNTCAVTGEAGRQSRQAARRLHRRNPRAHIVFAGCDATMEPERAQAISGVDLVIGNRDKDALVDRVIDAFADRVTTPALATEGDSRYLFVPARTRAFIKVQDGCNNHCTFCIVSTLRGEERSRPIAEVVQEIRQLTSMGYREVILTGVHLGGYGHDRNTDLMQLVATILAETDIERLRLSSLEPWDIPYRFFDLWRQSGGRLMPHLHLPLQSGSDSVLRRMARRYTTAQYARLVDEARRRIPDVMITTDVIVGFPGETDEEFSASLAFVRQMNFAHIHIFTYSPREGTAATRLPGHLPTAVKKARSRAMHQVMQESKMAHLDRLVGQVRSVLWEEAREEDPAQGTRTWSGLTDNYIRVHARVPADVDLHNAIVPTRLIAADEEGFMHGEPLLEQASWPKRELSQPLELAEMMALLTTEIAQ